MSQSELTTIGCSKNCGLIFVNPEENQQIGSGGGLTVCASAWGLKGSQFKPPRSSNLHEAQYGEVPRIFLEF